MLSPVSRILAVLAGIGVAVAFAPIRPSNLVRTQVNNNPMMAAQGPPSTDETDKNSFFFPWSNKDSGREIMPDQSQLLVEKRSTKDNSSASSNDEESMSPELIGAGAIAAFITIISGISSLANMDISPSDLIDMFQNILQNPSASLDAVVQSVESMGPLAPLYFGGAYTLAEILAIPAIPLTASAGYLFGPVEGTAIVLFSASIAAAISFVIGRTLLRDYVESVLEEYPKFAKVDRAIGREGFQLMLLLRLSPIFPFALSNYLYGASSISFNAFFWGTLFGFAPGTIAYVYTGYVGKALTDGGESAYPWYVYAGGLAALAAFMKFLADTATRVVEQMEEDEL